MQKKFFKKISIYCNPVPVRDSYSEGAERICLRVGHCLGSMLGALNKTYVPYRPVWCGSCALYPGLSRSNYLTPEPVRQGTEEWKRATLRLRGAL